MQPDGGTTIASQLPTGYWSISQVLAREAEYQGRPLPPTCPCCKGLEYIKDALPEHERRLGSPYQGYAYSTLVACPTCSEPERRAWLERNCGLEGEMLNVRLTHWHPGDWTDVDRRERNTRRGQRTKVQNAMQQKVRGRRGLLSLWGDFGGGKSMALAIVCNELRAAMVETYYSPLSVVLDHLKSLYARDADTSEYWQRLLDVPVLALDEVTRFKATEWAEQQVFMLVDKRYVRRASHLTLFATNDDPNQDDSYLFSRMKKGTVLELRGDFRPIKKGEWWE